MTTPLQLPNPRDVPLARSPLTLVVCQVRHNRVPDVSSPEKGIEVQQGLGRRYPVIEQQMSMTGTLILAGNSAPQMSQEQLGGWQMKSEDGAWTVTTTPDAFSVETSTYAGWTDFRGRIQELIEAITGAYGPALEQRIGLRYVDEIVHPEVKSPDGWRGWIRDELLGPLAHGEIGAAVRGLEQRVEFDAGDGYRVMLRHGTMQNPGNPATYILDHDCYRQVGRPFDVNALIESADVLHRVALQIFDAAITPELYKHFGPGEA